MILSKVSQNIKLLRAPPVQIEVANQCLNCKYTPSSEKGYFKDAEIFPQENCRLVVRESAEIELLQRRLQAIAKKL